MDPSWKEEFAPWILARGQTYFSEGRIFHIRQNGGAITASVAGTQTYTVDIEFSDELAVYMECDCPYCQSGRPCKHIAATLYALETGNFTFPNTPPADPLPTIHRIPIDEVWKTAIRKLPEAVVRQELIQTAAHDPTLRLHLTLLHLGHLPEGQLNNWKADLLDIASSYLGSNRRIPHDFVSGFLLDVRFFLQQKLTPLMAANAILDAFFLTWMVYETMMDIPMRDFDNSLSHLIDDCETAWYQQFQAVSEAQRAQIHGHYWSHRRAGWPYLRRLDGFFLGLPWSEPLYQKNITLYHQHKDSFSYLTDE